MKRLLIILAWLAGAAGMIMMLLGFIARLAGGILLGHFWSNYFYPGMAIIISGIFFFLGALTCNGKCAEK